MYLPSHFEESRPEALRRFIAAHPFATVVTGGGSGAPTADHLPLLLDPSRGAHGVLRGHVARANPVWRSEGECLVIFHGASAYVSPSWYPSKAATHKVVPTWNYSVVHARGRLRAIDDPAWLEGFVTELTERFESPRAQPWKVSDAPADYVATMLRAIVGIEIEVVELRGKFKLGQNRTPADRKGVADALAASADAVEREVGEAIRGLDAG